jgi:hypothetical protein
MVLEVAVHRSCDWAGLPIIKVLLSWKLRRGVRYLFCWMRKEFYIITNMISVFLCF